MHLSHFGHSRAGQTLIQGMEAKGAGKPHQGAPPDELNPGSKLTGLCGSLFFSLCSPAVISPQDPGHPETVTGIFLSFNNLEPNR